MTCKWANILKIQYIFSSTTCCWHSTIMHQVGRGKGTGNGAGREKEECVSERKEVLLDERKDSTLHTSAHLGDIQQAAKGEGSVWMPVWPINCPANGMMSPLLSLWSLKPEPSVWNLTGMQFSAAISWANDSRTLSAAEPHIDKNTIRVVKGQNKGKKKGGKQTVYSAC